MMTLVYRAIALLVFIFAGVELYKEEAPSMKINACMIMVPLALRILMIK